MWVCPKQSYDGCYGLLFGLQATLRRHHLSIIIVIIT